MGLFLSHPSSHVRLFVWFVLVFLFFFLCFCFGQPFSSLLVPFFLAPMTQGTKIAALTLRCRLRVLLCPPIYLDVLWFNCCTDRAKITSILLCPSCMSRVTAI